MTKKMKFNLSIDDVCPSNIKSLVSLEANQVFDVWGIKPTLFYTPNMSMVRMSKPERVLCKSIGLKSRISNESNYTPDLSDIPVAEYAMHGFTHWNKNPIHYNQEYYNLSTEETYRSVIASKDYIKFATNQKPIGFRPPGNGMNSHLWGALAHVGVKWIAPFSTHLQVESGELNGFKVMPMNYSIDDYIPGVVKELFLNCHMDGHDKFSASELNSLLIRLEAHGARMKYTTVKDYLGL